MNLTETIALIAAAAGGVATWVVILRWQRERIAHQQELLDWQRRLDEELQNARNDRDGLLDAMSDAFFIFDHSARILFANRAAHQLCNVHTLVNRPVREVFTDPRLVGALARCLDSPDPLQTQITLPQQASPLLNKETRGVTAWVIDAAKTPAPAGTPPCTRVIIRDITSEYQTDQIRKDFVANASHELRTPMAIICGYLENLLDNDMLEDPALSRRFLTVMRKHSDRMSRIIEDMLVISRLESGEDNQLKIEPFQLHHCVQDILERLESVTQSQSARILLELPDNPPIALHGDRFYWFQALFNLIENALKQNPHPGLTIEIGARESADHIEIWIADNGVGIPSADLPYIFRRFYRVDKQHSQREIKGTGLGLSIVKRAIEAHRGTITASSIPGTETKFLITMPKTPHLTADNTIDSAAVGRSA